MPAAATPGPAPAVMRAHGLDSVRALLMLLGLWIHSAAAYRSDGTWLLVDAQRSSFLLYTDAFITPFRMSGFFFVAGVVSAWSLQRYTRLEYLRTRFLRLGLPLLVGIFTLNALQYMLLSRYAATHCHAGTTACAVDMRSSLWLGHLWFLLDLILYTLLLVAAWPLLQRAGAALSRVSAAFAERCSVGLLAIVGVVACGLWRLAVGLLTTLAPPLRHDLLGFWSFTHFTEEGFFFVTGVLLALVPAFRERIVKPPDFLPTLLLGVAGTLSLWLLWENEPARDSLGGKALFALVTSVPRVLLICFAIAALLILHTRIASAMRRAVRWSYGIYMFHHLAIIAVVLLLIDVAWPVAAKFLVVLVVGSATAIACAALVERVPILSLLFNGKGLEPDAGVRNARLTSEEARDTPQ